jgi:hypothetical protein
MSIRKDKPRKCKNQNCNKVFVPTYSTTQAVCSSKCFNEYNKFVAANTAKKERNKEKNISPKNSETKTDVEKKLEYEINRMVRILDRGHNCISSNEPLGFDIRKYHAGHFYAIGGNNQIRFHLFNIFGQSVDQNTDKDGNHSDYKIFLKEVFGKEIQEYCISLKGLPALNLSKEEIKEKTIIAKRIIKWLDLQDRKFSNSERIELRRKFNQELEIYPNQ